MTTQTSVKSPKYARGQHPNSRANLQPPWKKGENGGQHPGYPLKSRLKDALNRRMKVPELDAPAGDHLVYSTLQGALLREPAPFHEVWDRVEGPLTGDKVALNFNEIKILVVYEERKKEVPT